ncbi:MAG TPA: 4Fe-4S dicluster domain-containing protein [Syntrophomonadaceae bacterium]|nr:4Fe-4S dicluster domain-containing protein [Syntrophomonadaceae bacterium]
MSEGTQYPVENLYKAIRLDEIDNALASEIKEECGVDIEMCLECGKCSGGCSNGHIFDFTPRKIVQLIKLGQEDRLLHMDALWTCVACQLCFDRCPSGINVARVMDYMREKSYKKGIKPTRETVQLFHELMLESVERIGRVAETNLVIKFNLRTRMYTKDADLGRRMFFKGKLNPFPSKTRNINQVRRIFKSIPLRGEEA